MVLSKYVFRKPYDTFKQKKKQIYKIGIVFKTNPDGYLVWVINLNSQQRFVQRRMQL